MKTAGLILITAIVSAVLAVAGFKYLDKKESPYYYTAEDKPVRFTNYPLNANSAAAATPDFVQAASAVSPAVVHIKTTYAASRGGSGNPLEDFFGSPQSSGPAMASGSGVLITPDGYIVTNNHVIEDAAQVEVVLPDKRSYKAKLIGRDPSTDLALVKVDGKNLPIVELGNSDEVRVGEWVLAVGYPLSLNSTVTAGIVSAKGRSIGILNRQSQEDFGGRQVANNSAIESFIQTDAAINPGNSGGALINATGQLVGINAAIASQTGSYAGYGFAIPVNLVKKVVSDFRKYGEVKRGYLGVSFPAPAVEDQILRDQGIDPATIKGVYITGIQPESGAAAAGLKAGDIIQSIDGVKVTSSAEFSERVARHRPGDKVEVTYLRGSRANNASITLKGEEEAKETIANTGLQSKLGASFAPIPANIKERYRLRSGVIITELQSGGFFDSAGIPKGTIITNINGKPVNSLADLDNAISSARSRMVRIDGITPDGTSFVFNFPLGA
ncbi:trypsin-like peptidase domain-containing protein [Adhaeribacter radiodurans]|uniref:Trypsin-like peptidase domain-containing protein n=1 Tax=Adhaeribacter radiodurans TaxID=2745197 RepID=A0A7L7L2A1_9BACT|nr:trypsin-like peptidase domain-containing protein [Adhaeribacter radiodurans]QMU26927.1 trypsin-like peptidase domain-containing protein [Adhaeribacter radiodurans]